MDGRPGWTIFSARKNANALTMGETPINSHRSEQIARDTLHILERGQYRSASGKTVDLAADLLDCTRRTQCYDADHLARIREAALVRPAMYGGLNFEVANESTLQGSARLAINQAGEKLGVLNFASAKNPGGGFLNGAQAQEESLARSSGLYASLLQCPSYYADHRMQRSALYSDKMIYSPHCPVFRNDEGTLLEQPYFVDFITSPAPNAGTIQQNEPALSDEIESTLRERASKILGLALHHNCAVLVLGAWGCGVFKNDPVLVAQIFQELLGPTRPYWGRFQKVVFSVWDRTRDQGTYRAFAERLRADL